MNKSEMARALAQRCGLSIERSTSLITGVVELIADELAAGQKVTVTGFGTWSVTQLGARAGTNPQTGAKMTIPARSRVRFKAGTQLADRLAR
jgi:DNA-binding protein HU-beta